MRIEPPYEFRIGLPRVYGRLALAALVLAVGGALLVAQDVTGTRPSWRTRTDAIWVFATVTDRDGRPITDLGRDDFTVSDDGIEQAVSQFSTERAPVSLGLLVDVSESMRGRRIEEARAALDRFLVDLLRPEDEAFLMAFNHAPRLVAAWKLSPASLAGRLDTTIPSGGTAIYDALERAVPEMNRRRHQRAAMVVISDGADTASDKTLVQIRSDLRRTDAFIYALAIEGVDDRPSTRVNPEALRAITDESGGYTALIKDVSQLGPETARIAEELNHQYLIGYQNPHTADGQFHSIRVRVKKPGFFVRSRRGYIAVKDMN